MSEPPADETLPLHLINASIRPPSKWLALFESRLLLETGFSLAAAGALQRLAPRGDGHAVLVIPGIGQNDGSTRLLRWFLRRQGFMPHGWGQGTNTGSGRAAAGLGEKLVALAAQSGGSVSLLGWSWGGVLARELAKEMPERVRCVVTLGAPFTGNPTANNLTWLFQLLNGKPAAVRPRWFRLREPPPVPNTSIYSRTDGIVAWRCCLNEVSDRNENVEVRASHLGMAHNAAALYVIADRLAQDPAHWKPFQAPASFSWVFPHPDTGRS